MLGGENLKSGKATKSASNMGKRFNLKKGKKIRQYEEAGKNEVGLSKQGEADEPIRAREAEDSN